MRVHTREFSHDAGWSEPLPVVDARRSLVLCFGAASYSIDAEPIEQMASSIGAPMIGCSTAGEIHGDRLSDETLSVAVVEFTATHVRTAAEPISDHGSFDAGVAVARRLAAPDLRGVFVLSDGLDVNGTELARGINAILAPRAVITGGLAGDGSRFETTWVLVDGVPRGGFVTAVGLYGDAVRIGHGSNGGWDAFGPERTVTKSRRNVVYEFDGLPALELYRDYLGELVAEMPASALLLPLAVREPGCDTRVVRTILGVDHDEQSLTLTGDLPEGHVVQLAQTNIDRLVAGAGDAAADSLAMASSRASLSIAVSGVGRRLMLADHTEDELESVLGACPESISQVGFYGYGELSPNGEGTCDLRNQTMTITTVGEVV